MTRLFIDTSSNLEVSVGLEIDGQKFMETERLDRKKAQVVLPMINELLKKHKVEIERIDSIELNEGPGSFTGLRIGASIANTLGTFLRIPINNKKVGELVDPIYN
jgi:tRNA threonylcarbamoyladenosine biosynthesis protein TsaB